MISDTKLASHHHVCSYLRQSLLLLRSLRYIYMTCMFVGTYVILALVYVIIKDCVIITLQQQRNTQVPKHIRYADLRPTRVLAYIYKTFNIFAISVFFEYGLCSIGLQDYCLLLDVFTLKATNALLSYKFIDLPLLEITSRYYRYSLPTWDSPYRSGKKLLNCTYIYRHTYVCTFIYAQRLHSKTLNILELLRERDIGLSINFFFNIIILLLCNCFLK